VDHLELPARRRLSVEVGVVLAITFGYSALGAALVLVDISLAPGGVGGQQVTINAPVLSATVLDICRSMLYSAHLMAFAALALYLLSRDGMRPRSVGFGFAKRDLVGGAGLAALIGLPGLALYLVGQHLGLAAHVAPATGYPWWRAPELVFLAFANAVAEETVVVGYLMTRLRQLGFAERTTLGASALLRGGYHLYQGWGGGAGNVVMGLFFGWAWRRAGRLWPLIVAHTLIDAVAFVGYTLLSGHVSWLP
jgi:membrane protease YdiL (CAAX protease family)